MGRMLKFVAYFIGAIVALMIVVVIAVSLLFDPNDYRDDIEMAVEKTTGRELQIDGDVEVVLMDDVYEGPFGSPVDVPGAPYLDHLGVLPQPLHEGLR